MMKLYIYCSQCHHDKVLTAEILIKLGVEDTIGVSPENIDAEKFKCSNCNSKSAAIVKSRICNKCRNRIPSGRIYAAPNATNCIDCISITINEDEEREEEQDLGNCKKCGTPLDWFVTKVDNKYFPGCKKCLRSKIIKHHFASKRKPKSS